MRAFQNVVVVYIISSYTDASVTRIQLGQNFMGACSHWKRLQLTCLVTTRWKMDPNNKLQTKSANTRNDIAVLELLQGWFFKNVINAFQCMVQLKIIHQWMVNLPSKLERNMNNLAILLPMQNTMWNVNARNLKLGMFCGAQGLWRPSKKFSTGKAPLQKIKRGANWSIGT